MVPLIDYRPITAENIMGLQHKLFKSKKPTLFVTASQVPSRITRCNTDLIVAAKSIGENNLKLVRVKNRKNN